MDLSKILVISGKAGLYELVSQTKGGAIVESLTDHKRFPVFKNDRISSLNEISIFTEEEDKPLREIMQDIFKKETEKAIPLDIKKAANNEIFAYFKEVLPNYDTERVHASDVKKILNWYNLLIAGGKIDLSQSEEESQTETEEKTEAETAQ